MIKWLTELVSDISCLFLFVEDYWNKGIWDSATSVSTVQFLPSSTFLIEQAPRGNFPLVLKRILKHKVEPQEKMREQWSFIGDNLMLHFKREPLELPTSGCWTSIRSMEPSGKCKSSPFICTLGCLHQHNGCFMLIPKTHNLWAQ